MNYKIIILLIVSSFIESSFIVLPAFANSEEIEQTRKEIAQSEAKRAQLAEQNRKIEADLKELQEKLVGLAGGVQKGEFNLSGSEEKLRILNEQMRAKNEALKNQRKKLAVLTQAALRLSQTPPEAMVMMPGDTLGTMKAGRALKMTSDSIREETNSIGLQMAELQRLKLKVAKNYEDTRQEQTDLDKERQALEKQLAQRKALQQKLGLKQQEEEEKLAALAQKAADLEGLVSSLKDYKLGRNAGGFETRPATPADKKERLRSFAEARGHVRTPVAGSVIRTFGISDGSNETSKGVTISTRAHAQVTAPYDGEVVFTGPFRGYGQMVIIRHSDDFHTLLAGLSKIDADAGQFLLEGEPIGAMGDSGSQNRLYVELRKNNQPVDPAPWISGMNKAGSRKK